MMKFLIDANLPFRLAKQLQRKGFDVIHTDDLPNKERTLDRELRNLSSSQDRIIITKDTDFLDSHVIQGIPKKLLLVSTGNIVNRDLLNLFDLHFEQITQLFEKYNLIEINNTEIVGHDNQDID